MTIQLGPFQLVAPVSAAITGSVTTSLDEDDIVSGGENIIITLTGARWKPSGVEFDAIRQDIIDGITSSGSELLGWNNEVRDNFAVTDVTRTSDQVVTISITAKANYDITADEEITVTVPASAISKDYEIVALPFFTIAQAATGIEFTAILDGGTMTPTRICRLTPVVTMTGTELAALDKSGKFVFPDSGGVEYDMGKASFEELAAGCSATYYNTYTGCSVTGVFGCLGPNASTLQRDSDNTWRKTGSVGRCEITMQLQVANYATYFGDLGLSGGGETAYYVV